MTRLTDRAVMRAPTAVAVIAAASVLWHHLPTRSDVYAPFPVSGALGTPVGGRAISAAVTGVQLAPELEIRSERFRSTSVAAIGRWLVIATDMRSGDRPERAHAELTIGTDRYLPADRLPPWATMSAAMQPGFLTRGAWVFDVAPSALQGGPITLHTWVGDGFLDSRLDIGIDLNDPRVIRSEAAVLTEPQVVVA